MKYKSTLVLSPADQTSSQKNR